MYFPISAVSGKGVKELLYDVVSLLEKHVKMHLSVYEQEFDPDNSCI